jgi:hypothetical protein
MTASPEAIVNAVAQLLHPDNDAASSNQNLSPTIRPLTNTDLAFDGQSLVHGHCSALWTRRRKRTGGIEEALKLKEGGGNNDSPRYVLAACTHFQNAGSPGDTRVVVKGINGKVYAYHLLLAHRAYTNPSDLVNPDRLALLTQEKSNADPLTVLHLCGHKWCLNADHLAIGSKRLNDEQTACHRLLQSATNLEELALLQRIGCHHPIPCWTIRYRGDFEDRHVWSAG